MVSVRVLARAVPRATSSFQSARCLSTSSLCSSSMRNAALFRKNAFQPSSLMSASSYLSSSGSIITRAALAKSFGNSVSRGFGSSAGLNDDQLTVKLAQELQVEQDLNEGPNSRNAMMKEALQSFSQESGYEIVDTQGNSEVVLTRKFEGETVKITFTIEDLKNSFDEDVAYNEDAEAEDAASEPAAPVEEGAEEDESSPFSQPFAAKLNINITKDGKPGALVIEALAQNSEIEVSDMFFFQDANLADPTTFEEVRTRERVYPGPTFQNLDEELQGLVENYIAERGVNEAMATFVADYIDWKEQNEYVKWLGDVKDFCS